MGTGRDNEGSKKPMKKFSDWMVERHPEELDEGLRDLANSRAVR